MRNLASIQKISNIRPIPGADAIEAIDVLGWTVVAQKGIHTVGDLVIYFEVDSFLNAEDPRYSSFEERFTNWGDKRGMRLKTIKLRGQISQGLILSLKEFKEIKNPKEGDDVTEILKIEKWESAAETNSNAGGGKTGGGKPFPTFIRKTDQERVQNTVKTILGSLHETFEATIKLDGSSMTVYHLNNSSKHFQNCLDETEERALRRMSWFKKQVYKLKKRFGYIPIPKDIVGVCSRNVELDVNGDNHFSQYVAANKILQAMRRIDLNIAIQGELIGPSIQKNYENVEANEYYIYDVFDIDNQKYLSPVLSRAIAALLGVKYVPVLNEKFELQSMITSVDGDVARQVVDNILAFAEGPGMNKNVKREGVVFKSNDSDFSFKAISNSYLLKKDK